MPEKMEKVVNHRAIVFDTEKFEMLKENIEKIMNDKKFKENEVVFIPFDEMLEISKLSTVLKEIRILYRVHTKGYNKGIAVSRKIEKTEKIKE